MEEKKFTSTQIYKEDLKWLKKRKIDREDRRVADTIADIIEKQRKTEEPIEVEQ